MSNFTNVGVDSSTTTGTGHIPIDNTSYPYTTIDSRYMDHYMNTLPLTQSDNIIIPSYV